MGNKMKWMYDGHPEAMKKAVMETPAIKKGVLSRKYASALYLLTGMEYVWPRIEKYANRYGIDYNGILNEPLSTGEQIIVELSWNLCNWYSHINFTPIDLIGGLDDAMFELAVNGIILRKSNSTMAMLGAGNERTYTVTECCPHCESEIEMRWNTDTQGFKAFCPVCGKRLMLCDECTHAKDSRGCDYDSRSDSCYFNLPVKADETILRVETPLGALIARRTYGPDNPGIWLDLRRPDVDSDMPLAFVEYTPAEGERGPEIITSVWGDEKQEDCIEKVVHEGIEDFFKIEDAK